MDVPTHLLPPNRKFDGSDANSDRPRRGSIGEQFIRLSSDVYADRVSRHSGADRPNARVISSSFCRQTRFVPDRSGLSDWVGVGAMFLSHGIQIFERQNNLAMSADDISDLQRTTLAALIRRNTRVQDIQDDVMFAVESEFLMRSDLIPSRPSELELPAVPFS
ncbi:peroxidase family protein [Arthrobacter sp. NicSoilB8]|uniref:peroxidase family protein n=1 Tax=Arthrobacter sp. NicSoilB8 TaxID=2830998 RepID=UPI001CC72C34|nr:peroxidase family protein [Arthrobacter sp. NicSoilB8]BCW72430.1 hypothetical protein NicSoilB8_34740 [Arthrobacter sp. NicSoilB8]